MKLKVCGLTRPEDVDYVNEAMPDYVGFVFAPSRRQVTPQQAVQLRKRLDRKILPVGVFVDAEIDFIERLYDNGIIKLAQLHGSEDEAYIRKLQACCGVSVVRAQRVRTKEDVKPTAADFPLYDSGAGSGETFNWEFLRHGVWRPYFLAGGITLENIDAAMACKPYAIDVSSGVEVDGYKDREKILAVAERVRGA